MDEFYAGQRPLTEPFPCRRIRSSTLENWRSFADEQGVSVSALVTVAVEHHRFAPSAGRRRAEAADRRLRQTSPGRKARPSHKVLVQRGTATASQAGVVWPENAEKRPRG